MFSKNIHSYQQLREGVKVIRLPAEEQLSVHHFAYRDAEQFISKLNHYTSIEAAAYFSNGRKFGSVKLFKAFIGEFVSRYFRMKGYNDGIRGLFVSLLMGMYRMVSYIKLWEIYEHQEKSVKDIYNERKEALLDEYRR